MPLRMRRFRNLRLRRSARTVDAIILGQSAMRELGTTPAPLTLRHATNSIEAELRLIDPAWRRPLSSGPPFRLRRPFQISSDVHKAVAMQFEGAAAGNLFVAS